MKNIEAFEVACAAVLGRLYGEFPRPVVLNVEALRTEAAIAPGLWWAEPDGDNLLAATIRWLRDEGFVRYTSEARGARFSALVLTARGLAALNRTPRVLEAQPTVGQRLRELACAASAETVGALVRLAIHAEAAP